MSAINSAGHAIADTMFRWSLEDESNEKLDGWIYIIACQQPLCVKIGYTKNHPLKRMKQLQTGNPSQLVMFGWYPGSLNQEKVLHEELSPFRMQGEWFRVDEDSRGILDRPFALARINNSLTGYSPGVDQ